MPRGMKGEVVSSVGRWSLGGSSAESALGLIVGFGWGVSSRRTPSQWSSVTVPRWHSHSAKIQIPGP